MMKVPKMFGAAIPGLRQEDLIKYATAAGAQVPQKPAIPAWGGQANQAPGEWYKNPGNPAGAQKPFVVGAPNQASQQPGWAGETQGITQPTPPPYSLAPRAQASAVEQAPKPGVLAQGPQASAVETSPAPPGAAGAGSGLYGSALDILAGNIKDSAPLPGTAAAISQRREAVAQFAKQAEARAGAQATQQGSIGQGTANAMEQGVKSDILNQLSNAELQNVQAVSAEKQGMLNSALSVGQAKEQFDTTMAQRKSEFDRNFGAEEGSKYTNMLERMSQDNPVLAAKLTNYLLSGKSGAVGEFTPEEVQQMKDFQAKKGVQDEKLNDIMGKVLESIPGQIAASNKADAQATSEADNTALIQSALKKTRSGAALSPDESGALLASGKLSVLVPAQVQSYGFDSSQYLNSEAGGLVKIGNKIAKVVPESGTSPGGKQYSGAAFEVGGQLYTIVGGKWYKFDPNAQYPLDADAARAVKDPTV